MYLSTRKIWLACFIGAFCLNVAVAQEEETDPVIKSANQAKAVADAQKAKYDAQAAAAKAKFGALADVDQEGGVTASTGAGLLEATLLGSEATRAAAERIAARLCAQAGCPAPPSPTTPAKKSSAPTTAPPCPMVQPTTGAQPIFIVGEDQKVTFEAFDGFELQAKLIEDQFNNVLALKPAGIKKLTAKGQSTSGVAPFLALAGNLLRSEYTVAGVSLTPDNLVLAKEVMRAARCQQIARPIKLPGEFTPPLDFSQNPALARLKTLDALRDQVSDKLADDTQDAKDLQEAAKNEKDKKKAALLLAQSEAYAPVVEALKAALKRYDDFVAMVGKADDKGVSPLSTIARQAYMSKALGDGGYLLVIKANFLGGSSYTRKNFFTFFGAMPFSVGGGAVASFTLIDGKSGNVIDSGVFAHSVPYNKVHKTIDRYVNGKP